MIDLSGVFLPVTTPFDPVTGEIDVVAFRINVRNWLEHPLAGVLVAGSTGESVFLDLDERDALVRTAADVLGDGAVVIAGAGAESTRNTIDSVRRAAESGADAVLVSPPAYFKGAMTPAALNRHYREVADAASVPVVVYQVPLRMSTLDLPTGLVAELSGHENIVGIKDSRGKMEKVAEILDAADDDFQVLVGSGALLYPALETGAVGGIVAVGLMAPAEAAGIYRRWRAHDHRAAGAFQERIARVHHRIVGGMGVPGVKAALDALGYHGGAPRPPLQPLPAERVAEAIEVLEAAGLAVEART